jgi:OOP family OmpA-OmpF porin
MCRYTTKITSMNFVLPSPFAPGRSAGTTRIKPQIFKTLSLLALPLVFASAAQAAEGAGFTENGWSMGMNVGRGVADINTEALRTELNAADFDVLSIDEDRHSRAYKAYIGYQLNSYLGLEGGYFDLGDFKFSANTDPFSSFRGKTEQKGWNLDLVGILPFTEGFSALARAGITRNQNRASFGANDSIDSNEYNGRDKFTSYKAGLGLQYDVSPVLTVRLEAERYMMDDFIGTKGDTDFYSLGLVYRFGVTNDYQPEPAPMPVRTVASTTATAAVVKADAEVLVLEDVHFNFDTAELNDNTKVILREHVQTLKANPDARVRIAGYTSASGSEEYNQALSERRAQSIKAFLILEGVEANRFKTIGFGENDPAQYEARPSVLRSDAAKANMRGLFEIIVE